MPLNTVEKGDSLELRVFNVLKYYLESDQLFIPGNRSQIFWKKGYYSQQRNSNIIFDIAIETLRSGADKYSLLTLVEVKNYSSSVPVGDVESFADKINQVGEHNTKGVFVTNAALQKSALQVARSKKIAVIQINDNDSIEFIAERRNDVGLPKTFDFITSVLTDEKKEGKVSFVATVDGMAFYNMSTFLKASGIIDELPKFEGAMKLDYLDEEVIEQRLNSLQLHRCYDNFSLNVDRFCESISALYDVDFDFSKSLNNGEYTGMLGKITCNPLIIYITKELQADIHRWRFTLAHEVSHLILHYFPYLEYFEHRMALFDNIILRDWNFPPMVIKRMEYQANLLASYILLPIHLLNDFIPKYFKTENIHKGHIYVDSQPLNRSAMMKILSEMEEKFAVSKEVAKLRLSKLGLLKGDIHDDSIHSSIRQLGFNTWNQ